VSADIRTLVVDDEPLARRGIAARLRRAGGIEVIQECAGGRQAVKAIRDLGVELVFLDIQMPGMDGFEVVEKVGPDAMPPTIFVTAYDEHALKAFDAQALDYLLKPIDDQRFDRALQRARRRVEDRREKSGGRERRLLIRDAGRVVFLDAGDVDWIEARGDYLRLHVAGRTHLMRHTMAEMERTIAGSGFARIHRSTIVNLSRIAELRRAGPREWTVRLRDGTRLALSRRFRAGLEARLPLPR
jgi:two-component system LytT family response regulator